MTKKKNVALILSVMMLATCLFPALGLAEGKKTSLEFHGLITEVVDGGVIVQDVEMGPVLLNVDPETVLEGILAETPLEVGMYVFAKSGGILTRTSPPQTHADRLGCYTLSGDVGEIFDGGILLTGDKLFGDVLVSLDEHMPHVFGGVPIKIYYDGSMAMSRPSKVTARYIVVPVIKGTVKAIDETSFTLEDENGESVNIAISANTLLPASWFSGDLTGRNAIIYYDGSQGGEGKTLTLSALEIVDPASIVLPSETIATPEPSEEPSPTPQGLVDNNPDGSDGSPSPGNPSLAPEPSASLAPRQSPTPSERVEPTESPESSPAPSETK